MKKLACLFSSFFCLSLLADQQTPMQAVSQDPNPSCRFGTKDRANIFVQGEMIWMLPLQDELAKYTQITPTDLEIKNCNSKFFPAIRMQLGFNTTQDGWDTSLIYTGFNYKHNNGYFNTAYPFNLTTTTLDGAISNKFIFNLGDIDLGRMMKISKKMCIRPHISLRGLFLSQKQTVKGSSSNSSALLDVAKIKGTLAGLAMGFDTLFKLSKSYSFYANFIGSSLVDGRKYLQKVYSGPTLDDLSISSEQKINYSSKIVYAYDFMMGFRWDRNFNDNRYHFAFNLGYEHHNYINLNYSTSEINQKFSSDFSLQGIAFGARFDF